MTMRGIVIYNNYLFVYDQINEDQPLKFHKNQHTYNTTGKKTM